MNQNKIKYTKLQKIKGILRTFLQGSNSLPTPRGLSETKFDRFFETYVANFERTLNNNGKLYTLNLFKSINNQAICLVTQETISPIPYHKSDRDGVSTLLTPIKSVLLGDHNESKRIILSVTRFHEQIRLKPEIELTPIVTPYNGTVSLDAFSTGFKTFLNESSVVNNLKANLPKLRSSDKLIGRIRSGPNGQAIVTSHYDAKAIFKNSTLYQALCTYNNLLSQNYITGHLNWCIEETLNLDLGEVITGKLSAASERAGKTRLFAIADYWSQNTLQTLHDWLMKILASLPTDATYDQDAGFERIKSKKVSYMASFDVTKFTDRVPLGPQVLMIEHYTHPDLASAWKTIIADREFRAPDGTMVKWQVGQPLGILSSWAACTLFHHHLIWYSAFLHFGDHRPFLGYQILGDDIAIWHKGVALVYARTLKELGVEINDSKSKLHEGSKNSVIFEFAKRISVANEEITGIPYDLLAVSSKSIYHYTDLVFYLVKSSFTMDHRNLVFPEYLSPKGVRYLQILLWERGIGRPTWVYTMGNEQESSLLNALRKEIAIVRIEGLEALVENLDKLCYSSDLELAMTKAGVTVTEPLIGYGGTHYHPIIHALNNVGMEMYETLPILEAIRNKIDANDITLPELKEIEYLPLPINDAHFERPGKRNPELLKKHSQLVLKASYKLNDAPYGFVMI
jgi:hypothetical protein